MCGRYSIFSEPKILAECFETLPPAEKLVPRYNASPSQLLPIVVSEGIHRTIRLFQWGLIPRWAKDASFASKMINARAETLQQKPAFKGLLKRNRCLILADGFFEWRKTSLGNEPVYISLESKKPFAFAGLWDSWNRSDGEILNTFAVITTNPNSLLESIHSRMPVILLQEDIAAWLDGSSNEEKLSHLLCPYPSKLMTAFRVSKDVNSPTNDNESLIKAVV